MARRAQARLSGNGPGLDALQPCRVLDFPWPGVTLWLFV